MRKKVKIKIPFKLCAELKNYLFREVLTGEVGASYSLEWEHTCRNELST